jgi:hypothetical protein
MRCCIEQELGAGSEELEGYGGRAPFGSGTGQLEAKEMMRREAAPQMKLKADS